MRHHPRRAAASALLVAITGTSLAGCDATPLEPESAADTASAAIVAAPGQTAAARPLDVALDDLIERVLPTLPAGDAAAGLLAAAAALRAVPDDGFAYGSAVERVVAALDEVARDPRAADAAHTLDVVRLTLSHATAPLHAAVRSRLEARLEIRPELHR